MGLTFQEIDDIGRFVLPILQKGMWTDLAFAAQNHIFASIFLNKERMLRDVESGSSIKWNIRIDNSGGNAGMTDLSDPDDLSSADSGLTGEIPFRFARASYSWDRREMMTMSSNTQIINYIKFREASMWGEYAETIESQMTSRPANVNDKRSLFGLFYWLIYNATEGHNGRKYSTAFPAGPGGIDHPRSANYTGNYTTPDFTLVNMVRNAIDKCQFNSPLPKSLQDTGAKGARPTRHIIISNFSTRRAFEDIADKRRPDGTWDLAAADDKVTIRGIEVVWASSFDGLTGSPVVGLDLDDCHLRFIPDFENTLTELLQLPNYHNKRGVFLDTVCNFVIEDRRRHFLFATADPAPDA